MVGKFPKHLDNHVTGDEKHRARE